MDSGGGGEAVAALEARLAAAARVRPGMLPGRVLVVKYGGAVLDDEALAAAFASDVARLLEAGARLVVVHGGGPALTRMSGRLGLETRFVDGQRVTSAELAEVAAMVLSGSLNQAVVSALVRAGVAAVGLSGSDAGLLAVRPYRPQGRDLGFVGEIEEVDPRLLWHLLGGGFVPVLSSTATGEGGERYNVNADVVAGAVAGALGAERLLYLSDVPGLVIDGRPVERIDAATALSAIAGGAIQGGMRPKVESALAALQTGVGRVDLIDGRVKHALGRQALLGEAPGTTVVADAAPAAGPPAARAGTLLERGERVLLGNYARYPLELVAGEGAWVRSGDGRTLLDFVAGVAVNVLGHGHPAIRRALAEAASLPLHVSNLYFSAPSVRLAERLAAAAGMERVFFCNSGAEAIEAALKLARKARPGRPRTVVFERSFHGRTLGALSATVQESYQAPFRPLLPGFVALPTGDFDAAAAAIDEQVAAVLVEPIQGEGGVRPLPPGFLAHLRKACDRAGALLIADEVQTGFGRTGTLFACEHEGVAPDAMAVAKALAGGLPMGALLVRGEAARAFAPGDHGCTFGGGPFVATVAQAVLDVLLEPGFLAGVRERGERLETRLRAIAERHPDTVTEVRGRGLMWGLGLGAPVAPELVAELHGLGLLTVPAGKETLRLLPPLVVSETEIDRAAALIGQALAGHEARR